jgi:hypothetical protein
LRGTFVVVPEPLRVWRATAQYVRARAPNGSRAVPERRALESRDVELRG